MRGAKAAGATEIVVMDCHGAPKGYTFNSLIADQLDPACDFVVQDEWTEYTDFLEQGCDGALFVGMHAMAGTPDGVMNHTVSGQAGRTSGSTASLSARPASTRRSVGRGLSRAARDRRRSLVPRRPRRSSARG